MGGKPGEYYLLYFGRETPVSWPFRLYKTAVTDGMRFAVDVIDTWNMTVTPVAGEFVTRKADSYYFSDEHARTVPLPGKPFRALRIRRVGDAAGRARAEAPAD